MKSTVTATDPLLLLVAVLCAVNTAVLVAAAILYLYSLHRARRPNAQGRSGHSGHSGHSGAAGAAGSCSALTCGAADPVSDPAYNMREIAKQSILLEEHLTVEAKFCVDCVTKHFLHIVGLANEAAMLAGADVDRYPLLGATGPTYGGLFERWLATRGEPGAHEERLQIAGEMRDFRKKVVAAYWPLGARPLIG